MKRKLEHLAAKLAFEELDDVQAEKLGRLASEDAETERAVREYASMRADLKRLRERTPEPMFSTDRLRDAILREGLERRRSAAASWSWVWAPVAVGVLAFAFASSRNNHGTPLPPFVDPGPSIAVRPNSGILALPSAPTASTSVAVPPKPTARTGRVVRHKAKEPVQLPVPNIRALLVLLAPQLDPVRERGTLYDKLTTSLNTGRIPDSGTVPMGKSSPIEMRAAGARPAKNERIVIIQQDTDGQTGAQRATEVESSANVSFGG